MEKTYKAKYEQLKLQYMHAVDTAFRLGFEQGQQASQLDQMAQQQQQQDAMMQAQQGAATDGPPGSEENNAAGPGGQPPPDAEAAQAEMEPASEHPDGTELDQHIAKLENLLGKSEVAPEDLGKALNEIKALRKAQVQAIELKKSTQAIKGIAAAMHRPTFKLNAQAAHNLNDTAKQALSMQHKIVNDVMKKWEEEEQRATKGIHQIISVEGFTKKEE
jgi:hypothetical protein